MIALIIVNLKFSSKTSRSFWDMTENEKLSGIPICLMYFHHSFIPRGVCFLPLESKQEATSGQTSQNICQKIKVKQLKVKNAQGKICTFIFKFKEIIKSVKSLFHSFCFAGILTMEFGTWSLSERSAQKICSCAVQNHSPKYITDWYLNVIHSFTFTTWYYPVSSCPFCLFWFFIFHLIVGRNLHYRSQTSWLWLYSSKLLLRICHQAQMILP